MNSHERVRHPLTARTGRRGFLRLTASLGVAGLVGPNLTAYANPIRAGGLTSLAGADLPAAVKTRTTIYTADKVAAARDNVARYPWAAALRDAAVAEAERLVALGDEDLWSRVPTQGVPRSYQVNQQLGSPITGKAVFQYGAYPYTGDPYVRPWKIVDPSSGYVFPTNDFGAYFASGLDEHANFHRELADPQYLVNELYPERGPGWGVDDGFGWVDGNGDRWTFIAYYAHWFVWHILTPQPSLIGTGLRSLRDAFLFTGDVRFAHAGLILLDRVADLYPSMETDPYKVADGFLNSDGLRGTGKTIGGIWETNRARALVQSYDAFFPMLAEDDPGGVVSFLSAKAAAYGLPSKQTPSDIRANIENGIVRQVYPGVRSTRIFGNFGMHQSALAAAAVVIDEPTASKEWLDFVFAAGQLLENPWRSTGGDVGPTLVDLVDRDGWINEAAPEYNQYPVGSLRSIADVLAGFDTYPAADIYAHPKYRAMTAVRPTLTMLNRFTPSIGDSGRMGAPLLLGSAPEFAAAFASYGRRTDAQMAYLANNGSTDGLFSDAFATDVPGLQSAIQSIIDEHGELALGSDQQTGYGFSALRAGRGDHARAAWMYWGSSMMHGHRDSLVLDVLAHGLDLASPLGYPTYADDRALRTEWENNTVASNTVVVDATGQLRQLVGRPVDFGVADTVRYAEAECPSVYPQTTRYRRSVTMVDVDEEHSYYVDVFRVRGGSQHVYSFHAVAPKAVASGLELVAQPTGNYAGPDVPPPDPRAKPRPGASGFDYLTAVERGTPGDHPFSVDWAVPDTWSVHSTPRDIHLRLHMLSHVDEAAFADGAPPQNRGGNPATARYLLARREGADLATQFVALLEPYEDQPLIASCENVEVRAVAGEVAPDDVAAVKVTLHNGRIDYIVHSVNPDLAVVVDDVVAVTGRQVVAGLRDGLLVAATGSDLRALRVRERHGWREVPVGSRTITGTVCDFTRELADSTMIEIRLDLPWAAYGCDPATLAGRAVYVDDTGQPRNATYMITRAVVSGRTLRLYTDTTAVRGYADDQDFTKGFTYDLAVGRSARIPQLRTWTA